MFKRALCLTVLFSIATFAELYSQEIIRIALLDYNAVLNQFPRQSQEFQRIQQLKTEVQKKIDSFKETLTELQKEYQQAEEQDNRAKMRRLQNDIDKQKEYGRKYIESKNEEIRILQKRATRSSQAKDLQKMLPDIISQVAREQGYSMVLDKNSQSIIWFDTSIDITEIVIQYLNKRME